MRVFSTISLLFLLSLQIAANSSWESVLREGSGQITVYFHPDQSSVEDSGNIMDLFEDELMKAFVSYVQDQYQVELAMEWVQLDGFSDVLTAVEGAESGYFGLSTVSITEERRKLFRFSAPYMADIQIIVSNTNLALASTEDELRLLLSGKRAVTIPKTTLEYELVKLKDSLAIDFKLDYVSNAAELLEELAADPEAFGYADLGNFLVSYNNLEDLRRQLFFPVKKEGIGMIYPLGSDWVEVVDEYFASEQFMIDRERISRKYLGEETGRLMSDMTKSSEFGLYEEIMVSTREKEIQYQELLRSTEREKESTAERNNLIFVLTFLSLSGLTLFISNRIKTRANKLMKHQQGIISERNGELKELNDEKNKLISVLAHDLRSPLSNIQGCALILSDEKDLSDQAKKMVGIIDDSSNRVKSMISKILDVQAIESGSRNVQIEVLSPKDLIREVVQQNAERAQKKSIAVSVAGEDGLQASADRFYLAQAIENLLQNAIKFSEPFSQVKLFVEKAEDAVRLTVQDFGPGFTDADKKKMFKEFSKMSAKPTGGENSTGLGLSIVKKYTELMGGKISFDSVHGEGTSFYIDLNEA